MNTLVIDITDGWLQQVRRVPSPNADCRPAGTELELIVIHGISLPPGEFGGPAIDELFCNCLDPAAHPYYRDVATLRVSSHVLISRDGSLTQYVPFHRRAWHAGESSFAGRDACNDFSVGIELEGCDDVPYTEDQYETLADLVRGLRQAYPSLCEAPVVGHEHIAPGRKTDPGPAFNWHRLTAMIGNENSRSSLA